MSAKASRRMARRSFVTITKDQVLIVVRQPSKRKPTVREKTKKVSVETFVYDFAGDLYGEEIRVELLTFERPEMKFADFQKLQLRIQADVAAGREFFRRRREQDQEHTAERTD